LPDDDTPGSGAPFSRIWRCKIPAPVFWPQVKTAQQQAPFHTPPRGPLEQEVPFARRYAGVRRRRLHLEKDRVIQIQRALAKAGYLKEPPDGLWGPMTAKAMREFQQANGFEPTGLPEAKSLMKLGLGPHSLPPGLSGATAASKSGNTSDAGVSSSPSSSAGPTNNDPE
jgi:peptidoglycan hydrolase-like protein with peptidoglycan-binding domain